MSAKRFHSREVAMESCIAPWELGRLLEPSTSSSSSFIISYPNAKLDKIFFKSWVLRIPHCLRDLSGFMSYKLIYTMVYMIDGGSPIRCCIEMSIVTTYTVKRELYTKNENSSHKNNNFCIKNTKNTPQIEKCWYQYTLFFFGVKNRAMPKHPILLFTKTLKSTPKLEKYFFLKNINYKFC